MLPGAVVRAVRLEGSTLRVTVSHPTGLAAALRVPPQAIDWVAGLAARLPPTTGIGPVPRHRARWSTRRAGDVRGQAAWKRRGTARSGTTRYGAQHRGTVRHGLSGLGSPSPGLRPGLGLGSPSFGLRPGLGLGEPSPGLEHVAGAKDFYQNVYKRERRTQLEVLILQRNKSPHVCMPPSNLICSPLEASRQVLSGPAFRGLLRVPLNWECSSWYKLLLLVPGPLNWECQLVKITPACAVELGMPQLVQITPCCAVEVGMLQSVPNSLV